MDDLDDLLNSLGGPSVAAPPPQQHNSFAPPPAAGGGDDLDDLLNELGGGGAPPPMPARQQQQPVQAQRSFAPAAAAPPPAAGGDDLDDLLNELGGGGAPPPMPARQQQPPVQAQRSFAPAAAAPAPAAGGDDLDDLLNELGGGGAPPPQPQRTPSYSQAPVAAAPAAGGDDLDDLLNELGGGGAPAAAAPAMPARPQQQQAQPQRSFAAAPAPAAGGDDLDSLLNELGGAPAPAQPQRTPSYSNAPAAAPQQQQRSFAAAPAPAPAAGGDDLDSLLNELGGAPAPAQPQRTPSYSNAPAAAAPPPAAAGGGDDLDNLLNELGAPPAQSAACPAARSRGPPAGGYNSPSRGPAPNYNTPAAAPVGGGGDDLDLMLKGLSNQMADIDDGAPAARGMCFTCRRPILGEIIQAMGKAFHPECFMCGNCQEPLGTRNFYEADGRPNCEKCYQSLFCSVCARCNKPVLDRCITALGRKWHPECFVCAKCSASFPDGMFFEKEGRPWCKGCYSQNFSYRCGMCNQGITGDVVNALGRHWCPGCFVCFHCRMPFEGGTFFAKEGKPYCRQHYSMQSGATCGGCGQPITGRVVEGLGRKWMPECFVCAFCNNPLTGGGYQEHEGRPYCRGCSQRMF